MMTKSDVSISPTPASDREQLLSLIMRALTMADSLDLPLVAAHLSQALFTLDAEGKPSL